MSKPTTPMIIVLVLGWLWMPAGLAEETQPANVQSGTLLLRMQAGIVAATRTNTDVTMDISGLVARDAG